MATFRGHLSDASPSVYPWPLPHLLSHQLISLQTKLEIGSVVPALLPLAL